MEKAMCDLKHANVEEHLQANDNRLDKHDEEIKALQIGQATTNTHVDDICIKLDKLIAAIYDVIKSTIGGIIVVGVGFIVWYIQKL